jgi:peptidoglycan/xylan/chitin deacetylase (PgdA/CDA1 family)
MKAALRGWLGRTVLRHNWILPLVKGRRFVFLFHDVSAASEPHHHKSYSVTPEVFYGQIEALQALFEMVSLDAACNPDSACSRNQACVVFDDGFRSVSTVAAPFLVARGIPFAVFANMRAVREDRLWCSDVVFGSSDSRYLRSAYERYIDPAVVGFERFERDPLDYLIPAPNLREDYEPLTYSAGKPGTRVYMDEAEVRGLRAHGALVGSHTVSHRVMARLSDVAIRAEVADNRRYLESLLQAEVRHFAFPFGFPGMFDGRATDAARSQHEHLYSTDRVFFTGGDLKLTGLILPRIGLRNERRPEILSSVNTAFFASRRSQLVR